MKTLKPKDIQVTDGFWKSRIDVLINTIVPYQWATLNNQTEGVSSSAIENFRVAAGESEGKHEGPIFQDSDVAKWMEAAAYSLQHQPNAELEQTIDELVRLIGKAQQDDGYFHTFFTTEGAGRRWDDMTDGHEMYCAGHLIEAAAAYFDATGKREFMEIMERYVHLIEREFGPEANRSYGGHPEIEIALYRLAEAAGNSRYCDLADYFVNIRGSVENFHKSTPAVEGMTPRTRWFESDYYLAHKPVREMNEVEGHAVRATYLYAAMTDQYSRTGEPALGNTLRTLWDNLESRRVYITGGLGSQSRGERFTLDYDLPAERGYTETCASIGLLFWAWRMTLAETDSRYADMAERALYNGALAGISLDGKGYFYVNPLEVTPRLAHYREDLTHIETHRLPWFGCACCPTNIARLLGSVAQYAYSYDSAAIFVHQYIPSKTEIPIEHSRIGFELQTGYPWDGAVRIQLSLDADCRFTLHLRIPAWCDPDQEHNHRDPNVGRGLYSLTVNGQECQSLSTRKGCISLERCWRQGDIIELNMKMEAHLIRANTKVSEQAGKVAIAYGPLIYCVEEIDNGAELQELIIDSKAKIETCPQNIALGIHGVVLRLGGYRERSTDAALYSAHNRIDREAVSIIAVPYFQWGNRDQNGEMRVWLRQE